MHFLKVQVQHGGDIYEIILPTRSSEPTVEDLQNYLEQQFDVPKESQRIMFKGQNLHEKPKSRLRSFAVTNASLIRLVGRKQPIRN